MNYSTVIIDYLSPQFPLPAPNSRLRQYYHSITDDLHRIYKKINLGFSLCVRGSVAQDDDDNK